MGSFFGEIRANFEAKRITEPAIKRAELLTRCDENTYQLFRNLCAPHKPATKQYDELKQLLCNHLKPAPSEVMERCMYNRARQEQNETVAEFAARLRQLSLHCNFTDLNTALRDKFICGIRDEATRIELFKQATVTFDSAFKEATARERAVENAAGALKTLTDKAYKQEHFFHDQQNRTTKDKKTSFKPSYNSQRNNDIICYCCGNTGHATRSCKYREQTCRFCHIKGHLERACFRKKKSGNKFLQEKDSGTNHEYVDGATNEAGTPAESSHYVDFHAMNSMNNRHNFKMNGLEANPMFLNVDINGKTINMEIDTGSYFAVMLDGFVKNNFKNLKITDSTIQLLGYEDNTMKPLGQLENLKVTFNNKTENLNYLIYVIL